MTPENCSLENIANTRIPRYLIQLDIYIFFILAVGFWYIHRDFTTIEIS